MNSSADEMVQIFIPSNSLPGDKINVRLLDGRILEIIIPTNCKPGDPLNILVPATVPAKPLRTNSSITTVSTSDTTNSITTVTNTNEMSDAKKSVGAAGVALAGGVILSGPVVGVVLAGGALYASTRSDKLGDTTKAVGEATIRAIDKGRELGNKYGVFDKIKEATSATYNKAKEINEEYKVTDKMKVVAISATEKVKELDNKYKISETTSKAVLSGVTAGAREITKLAASAPPTTNPP
jgi:hypothetical protein